MDGLKNSLYCFTVCDERPICIFGIVPENLIGSKAVIWMLGTDEMEKIKIRFVKNSRKMIDMLLDRYEYLHNYVDCRNHKTIAWLKFLGAELKSPVSYGVDSDLFRYFSFTRR